MSRYLLLCAVAVVCVLTARDASAVTPRSPTLVDQLRAPAKKPRSASRSLLDFTVPGPPRARAVFETIDPNINGDGSMVGAYANPFDGTIHAAPGTSGKSLAERLMLGHELGHLFDEQVLTDGDRRYFTRIMHAPAGPWNRGQALGRVEGEISPNEWFSDFYGALAGRAPSNVSVGTYATITPKRLRNFGAALERLGRRRDLAPVDLVGLLASES